MHTAPVPLPLWLHLLNLQRPNPAGVRGHRQFRTGRRLIGVTPVRELPGALLVLLLHPRL